MKKIHKFVLISYIGPMVLTFFLVMFVLMMNILWKYIDELVGKGLGIGVIMELLGYATINMIPMGLPLATLLAAIMTMGNLGENYELLAMKSAGMSLMRIMKPLLILVFFIAVGSFFVANNLMPYANQRSASLLWDIRQQKEALEFKDGLFFNGVENMSIRVGHQDPKTAKLTDVLIYDTSKPNVMTTYVADSGYIKLSDDKLFLMIDLYNGESYEQTRGTGSKWHDNNVVKHSIFAYQSGALSTKGFDFQRTDQELFNGPQTKNIAQLERGIDSLDKVVKLNTTRSYEPLLKQQLFVNDRYIIPITDTTETPLPEIDRTKYQKALVVDSLAGLDIRTKKQIWSMAHSSAVSSRSSITFDEGSSKDAINLLYRNKVEWHRKISLPVSLIIFFLIGAALGAIIRKGGLGLPMVVSVGFFVIYYIISSTGEKFAKEGTWDALPGMWLSTFILAPLAVFLIIKSTNDSRLFNMERYYKTYYRVKGYVIEHKPKWFKKHKKRQNEQVNS